MDKRTLRLRTPVFLLLALGALLLAGCSDGGGSATTVPTAAPAPAPSNLTPEQKQAYDEAVRNAQPRSGAPAGR